MQDFFSLNLSALAIRSPALALRLNEFEPNQDFEVYQGNDPLNINIIDKRSNTPLFQGNPLEETNAKIESFVVHLKVSRMHHDSRRRINGEGGCILDTVIRLDKFNPKLSQINRLPMPYDFPSCTS